MIPEIINTFSRPENMVQTFWHDDIIHETMNREWKKFVGILGIEVGLRFWLHIELKAKETMWNHYFAENVILT